MERKGWSNRGHLAFIGCYLGFTLMNPQLARADASEAGALYICDTQHNTFRLLGTDVTSDDPSSLSGKTQLIPPGQPSISCALDATHNLRGKVDVFPPSEGQCQGDGTVTIRSLSVKDVELVPDAPSFDEACIGQDPLEALRVTLKGHLLTLELCYDKNVASPTPTPLEKLACDSKQMDIDAIAAAKAKTVHDLADPATQAAKAATRLPPNNDFATVFGAPDGIPACAHWRSSFLHTIQANGYGLPHGWIAGSANERTYIHAGNPQVCDANAEPLCKAKAYLLAGDRVDVGMICGQWSFIRYVPPTHATLPTEGWVETSRLYAVDSLITPAPGKGSWQADSPPAKAGQPNPAQDKTAVITLATMNRITDLETALSLGTWRPTTDLPAQVQRLLAAGIPVDASKPGRGTALTRAIEVNNVDIAQVLLKAGANPNTVAEEAPDQSDTFAGTTPLLQAVIAFERHLDPTLTRLLLEAGAHPNFRMDGEYENDPELGRRMPALGGVTALHLAAEYGYLNITQLLLDHGADPMLARSDGALPADIARTNRHKEVAALINSYASRAKAATADKNSMPTPSPSAPVPAQ